MTPLATRLRELASDKWEERYSRITAADAVAVLALLDAAKRASISIAARGPAHLEAELDAAIAALESPK